MAVAKIDAPQPVGPLLLVHHKPAWQRGFEREPSCRLWRPRAWWRSGSGHTFSRANPLVAGGEMPLEPGRRIDDVMVRCADRGPTLEVT